MSPCASLWSVSTGPITFSLPPKEFTSVEQLRGKVLGGYTAQATVNTILIELLRKRGIKPDEYKILNVGTARLPALLSGNVPAAVLNGLETAKAVKRVFVRWRERRMRLNSPPAA
jgi:ABC-type nitrate/sulfonate/bicarbonate transport system substrate-binding protein